MLLANSKFEINPKRPQITPVDFSTIVEKSTTFDHIFAMAEPDKYFLIILNMITFS